MTIRSAIYTRKSIKKGVDQKLNIPDIQQQRSACEHYILTQADNGWEVVEKRYDDDGHNGDNMDRPGLRELLSDIKAGLIHHVIVYKLEVLTRKLQNFSTIIDLLDQHTVKLVSVTQPLDALSPNYREILNTFSSIEAGLDEESC
jgi:DNA invertase Pin-like site-specific DNA recombinase